MENMERDYYENGQLKLECPLSNGVRHGACKEFFESGALRCRSNFCDGLLDGPREAFTENGLIICRHVYKKGFVVDSFVAIHGRGGAIIFYEYWEKGRCRCYDRNNRLCREYGLFNGVYYGAFREYYENGRLRTEEFYGENGLDGFAKYWSDDGLKCNVYLYVDGEECGCKKMEYYENGMLSSEMDVVGDIPDGLEVSYHENGELQTSYFFVKGFVKDGPADYRDENGDSILFTHWENNISKIYANDGTLVARHSHYRNLENGKMESYEKDGTKITYCFDGKECESKEEFLELTFGHIAEKLERSLSRFSGVEVDAFVKFFQDQYAEIMRQDNAEEEFFNYEELLRLPEGMERLEWIVRLAIREFMLRLRLPNDGPTEERVVANLLKLIG